ncbi:MAG: heavy-metal-associated domain-containing protein [Phycisphaerales bacterium]|nr:heavy-metal-associated domain-containing protein [Planctomycetota bacterium]MCH8509316.1 heavy-metal-associated domain-containing protein [Phycisphaerales bacterium]
MFSLNHRAARLAAAALSGFALSAALLATGCGSTQTRAELDQDLPEQITGPGVVMSVEGLGCPMCAESIYVLLTDVDGVTDSKVNLDSGTVDVTFAEGATVSRRALTRAVTNGGFSYRGMRIKE